MKQGFRQSMAGLHTWSGMLLGWLLFVIFACGTISYFQEEVTRWMQPEVVPARDQATAIAQAQAWLGRHVPDAPSWFIAPPGRRGAVTKVYWEALASALAGAPTSATLDGTGREVTARRTAGGFFLYRMHYDLHYLPVIWARYLVGLAAMFMLVAIISGVIIHRRIFADFFMLRFGKGLRSWLDAHNVTSVLALPFHLMITYTGLVCLGSLYAPAPVLAAYMSDDAYYSAAFPSAFEVKASGEGAALAELSRMAQAAAARFSAPEVGYVLVSHPGDRAARVTVTSAPGASFDARGEALSFDGPTGALLAPPPERGPAQRSESVMIGLHAGRYADAVLRSLYFVSGLFGTAMVATGLVLWTLKRRSRLPDPSRPNFSLRLVERLNVSAIIGLPIGIAAYFLANRLLPTTLAARADREIAAMFCAWGVATLWAIARPPRRAWMELAAVAALAFAALPFVSAIAVGPSWVLSSQGGTSLFVVFDMVMFGTAIIAAMISWLVSRGSAAAGAHR